MQVRITHGQTGQSFITEIADLASALPGREDYIQALCEEATVVELGTYIGDLDTVTWEYA